jgi:hypothetical protein
MQYAHRVVAPPQSHLSLVKIVQSIVMIVSRSSAPLVPDVMTLAVAIVVAVVTVVVEVVIAVKVVVIVATAGSFM